MNINTLITDEHISFYRENGFVKVENMLTGEELEQLRDYLEEAMHTESSRSVQTDKQGGLYYRVLNQKVNTWRDHAGMGKFSFHERFAQSALALTGSEEIRFFHDHGLWKMPNDSKPTPWHQDTPYWPINEAEKGMMSIWIALDDVNEQNGCMAFVPKSHKVGKLTSIDLANPQNIFDYVEGGQLNDQKPVVVPLKAGSCTFHNGLTFHYAHANVTDRPRRALAIIYMPDGITYSGKAHVITDELGLEKDQALKGPLFPLLAKRNT
ncbi:phytanoyl-CoA dioxygenase family protein [Paenibacillus roseipurpureus]|uniref:Phytanoyl-CoA dioxygenase family protein n=1 Tax=Paenibacillus roseopurpureus TaxID=2918901 RepID=A0AA96LQ91_9BACL|nr:phytanoyl-CoA dioxygenase family protein [Paenibacillus sp. MBLB1832]WNR45327.1 phytanoyl-CoA dioxygenase family protein [Paenibacillus sp. MBLB1832]